MARWKVVVAWTAAVVCVALSVTGIAMTLANRQLEIKLQAGQNRLGASLLSPQGQQLTANVLQDMGQAAVADTAMRALLARHGMQLQTPAATNAPVETPAAPAAATGVAP